MAGNRRRTQTLGMVLGCLVVGGRVAAATHSIAWGLAATLGIGAVGTLVLVLSARATRRRLAALPSDVAEVRGSVDATCLPWPWPVLAAETVGAFSGQQAMWPPVVLVIEGDELTVTKQRGRPLRAAVACASVRSVTVGDPGWADVRLSFALADGSELRVRATAPPSAAEAIAERFRQAVARAAAAREAAGVATRDATNGGLRVTSPPPPWRTPPRRAIGLWFVTLPVGFAGVVGIADAPFAGAAGIALMVLGFVGFLARPPWLGRDWPRWRRPQRRRTWSTPTAPVRPGGWPRWGRRARWRGGHGGPTAVRWPTTQRCATRSSRPAADPGEHCFPWSGL